MLIYLKSIIDVYEIIFYAWRVYFRLTVPCANAPMTIAAGPSLGTIVLGHTASPALNDVENRGHPGGRWSDTGFLMSFNKR